MRKFSIPGAIRIDVIFEVGLERSRCGEDALGVRFGGKTHPVGANTRQSTHKQQRSGLCRQLEQLSLDRSRVCRTIRLSLRATRPDVTRLIGAALAFSRECWMTAPGVPVGRSLSYNVELCLQHVSGHHHRLMRGGNLEIEVGDKQKEFLPLPRIDFYSVHGFESR
jgi:hypothetical protein